MPAQFTGKTLLTYYRIEEFIMRVPAGDLYRATDTRSGLALALTLLPRSIAENSEHLKSIEAESARLQALAHPNLAVFRGLFRTPTLAFLLEEWIDGPSLADLLRTGRLMQAGEALVIIKSVCAALETLHRAGFLHLEVCPELVRIDRRGIVRLGGVGTARRPDGPTLPASKFPPLYAAPELIQGGALTPAADMYSLAVIVYQLTTGAWINGRAAPKTIEAVRRAQVEDAPVPPAGIASGLPDHFSRMLLWALRKDPRDRLKTTTEFLSALALAAQTKIEEIPARVGPQAAPVCAGFLDQWNFQPEPKPNLIAQDLLPLEDRLNTIARPAPKKRSFNFAPFFIILLLAGFGSLFWLVKPAPQGVIPTLTAVPTAAGTSIPTLVRSPTPRPTDEHGGRIVFTCTRGDYNQICFVNRDGSGLIQMTDMQANNYYPTFTPDGSGLLFTSNRNGAFDLYLQSFDNQELTQLTDHIGNVISPSFSPDGRQIVFGNQAGQGPTAIWIANADGLNARQVYKGANPVAGMAWSPDGDRIAYAVSTGIPDDYQIYIMNAAGKNHVRISQGLMGIGGSVAWSPDGKFLLVHAGPAAAKDIFRIDAASGAFTQLTFGGNNAGAVYSPDGRYILFNSRRNQDQADLYIMSADGSNEQQLTNDPEPDWGAQWTR